MKLLSFYGELMCNFMWPAKTFKDVGNEKEIKHEDEWRDEIKFVNVEA